MLLDNTKNGFILKSNFELRKAYLLFKIISNKTLTNIGKTKSLHEMLFSDTRFLIQLDFLNRLSLILGKEPLIFM